MNTNNEFYANCFTEIEEGKVNSKFNKTTMKCFDSEDNKFSMDCEGNLVVNSIITRETNNLKTDFDAIYPIGSVYIAVNDINPSTLFGGTWEQIKDTFILGCGDKYQNGSIGGEESHTLTINEMPNHNHNISKRTAPQKDFNFGLDVMHFSGDYYDDSYRITMETANVGGNTSHNNMPPYLAVYIWKRIA